MLAANIETIFNYDLGLTYKTRLRGGADEPFYQAPKPGHSHAIIWYRADYVRSALHELAHWCVAGPERRRRDDYGYWYAPDGRSADQQRLFFQVEARPQAIERLFCKALEIPFEVSVDNLNSVCEASDVAAFDAEVEALATRLLVCGLGPRARSLLASMRAFQMNGDHDLTEAC